MTEAKPTPSPCPSGTKLSKFDASPLSDPTDTYTLLVPSNTVP